MKISKKISIGIIALALVLTAFAPFIKAKADGAYTLTIHANGNHTLSELDGKHLKVDGQFVELEDDSKNPIGDVDCSDDKNCTITVSDGKAGKFSFNSNSFSLFVGTETVTFDREFNSNTTIEVDDQFDPAPHFDGKAYLVWSCDSGLCFHFFDNIPNFDDGNSTYYKDSDITADGTGDVFSIDAEYKGWTTQERLDAWEVAYMAYTGESTVDYTTVDPKDAIGLPVDMRPYEDQAVTAGACTREDPQDVFQGCVDNYVATVLGVWVSRMQLQPVGEPEENNAYVSYGDRNFKVVIYNDKYKGVSLGSLNELNYYPSSWTNPFIKRDQYDISDTSKSNPTSIDTILLENTVTIKPINVNNFSIESMVALDVPEDAVTVSKNGSEWKIVFSSNYYDSVTFEVKDNKGETSFLNIKRSTVDAWLNNINNEPCLYAEFFFDANKSYSDYIMTAKIEYKDGTTKNVELEAIDYIDDGLGNITREYEVKESDFGGKGLKKSTFVYMFKDRSEAENVKRAYMNIEFKGSTASNYAGAFAGSGKGVLANIYEGGE